MGVPLQRLHFFNHDACTGCLALIQPDFLHSQIGDLAVIQKANSLHAIEYSLRQIVAIRFRRMVFCFDWRPLPLFRFRDSKVDMDLNAEWAAHDVYHPVCLHREASFLSDKGFVLP